MNKNIVLLFSLFSIFFLTGCESPITINPFYIDFKYFLTEQSENNKKIELNFTPMDLNKDGLTKDEILSISKKVKDLFSIIGDKEFYFQHFNDLNSFLNPIMYYFNQSYLNEVLLNKNSDIKNVIDNIYYKEFTFFKEANLISVEKNSDNYICTIEIVSVGDSEDFNSELIDITFDKNMLIINDEISSIFTSKQNTINPITEENSVLQNDHNEFWSKINELFEYLKDENLYKQVSAENPDSKKEMLLDNLIITADIEDKTYLKSLFLDAEGSFKNIFLKSVKVQDIKHLAETIYTYQIGNGLYEFTYNRAINKIMKVEKIPNK